MTLSIRVWCCSLCLQVSRGQTTDEMPAPDKRFGEIGSKVIIRTLAHPIAGSDSPNCSAVAPQLRQAAGMLVASKAKAS